MKPQNPNKLNTLLRNSAIILGMTGTLFAGCKKPLDIINKGFDVDLFSKNLTESFEGKTVGYAFAIGRDGKIARYGAGGFARMAIDAPGKDYLITTRQDIASCSKTITALATLKALEDKNLDEEAFLSTFLPSSWNIPEANKKIRIKHLLAHKTGLTKFGGSYAELRTCMETATTGFGDDISFYDYDNVNYALCRILIPCIVNGKDAYEGESDDITDDKISTFHLNYVRGKIFKVAGLPDYADINVGPWNASGPISPKSPDRNMTLHYNFAKPAVNGIGVYSSYLGAGPGGWYMNAAEVAQVLLTAEAGKIVSVEMLKRMKDKLMGFDSKITGERGNYFWKNGGWSEKAEGRGLSTYIMHFPNNVQVAWQTNSIQHTIGNPAVAIAKAYDNAWR